MEPGVIRMFSSSPPPMEDDDDDDFGDFGTFAGIPGSVSFSELETPNTFDQNRALGADSPPELPNGEAVRSDRTEPRKPNGLTNGFEEKPNEEFADFTAFTDENMDQNVDQDTEQEVQDLKRGRDDQETQSLNLDLDQNDQEVQDIDQNVDQDLNQDTEQDLDPDGIEQEVRDINDSVDPDCPESGSPCGEAGSEVDEDFGAFGGGFGDFQPDQDDNSFGNFSSSGDAGWNAFAAPPGETGAESDWAAFGAAETETREEERTEDEETVAPCGRLEKLFLSSFVSPAVSRLEAEPVASLRRLLDHGAVWTRLQDVHEALGLRYQWGGSHGNKALLGCLGIDTRNILFTGQKKQPVIVPMYAAGLGMLEPTKEPVKPVSAAEMIASIALTPPAAPEENFQQEALPPVQFDWSSSGLTNPLDASGGSSLLNLDFFGPVEDSCGSASFPGVDPELYELTTAKLESGGRVADAFARLMSTMEKTSTSTRKPRKEENLSEEAARVIAALPDLSFMQAKVLMFPATLTPLP